ncbi:MAG: hydrolase [Patescibacteria group bacterium]|nr:hypothetical protein [Patescibacteria group bacterium]MBU2508868.1 hypothetical protein [Patescibacteria group bacterium]
MTNTNKECCPVFDPSKWDEKTHTWNNKKFIKETIPTLFHIPFPPMIGKKITKMWKAADEVKMVEVNKQDVLVLFTDPSPFKSELFFSVTGDVPSANNVAISGTFMAKVFDGPYNSIPKFLKVMDEYLSGKGKKSKKYYVHYAYCPKCAKEVGHNYTVLFAKV